MWMRGGTSKGAVFLAGDLPGDVGLRDRFLLAMMGSPDMRQIDGMGGGDPLSSKVAIVGKSARAGVDVDYLFLQVSVGEARVSDSQNCGNMLAAVGPFAIERGLVGAAGKVSMTVFMENTGQRAEVTVICADGRPLYEGDAEIDGVPGTAAPVAISFQKEAGGGALLPTGNEVDVIDALEVTLIDNGMACVILRAADLSISGTMRPEELEADVGLRARLEKIRLLAGPMMGLGDVVDKTVPKMTLVAPPKQGGMILTRSFIPHRCHVAIGVLAAVTVASACLLKTGPAAEVAQLPSDGGARLKVEHPSGATVLVAERNEAGEIQGTAILRTARKLFDGEVFA